nr:uncharacterized protein LOC111990387 [Quercus suber]
MANEEDYENVAFSDYHDFNSEYEKGKAVIDPNIGSNSDPLLKIDLSHPSKIPPPRPTPIPIPTPPPTIDSNLQPHRLFTQLNPFHSRGPKWFSETEISEEERYECSLYGEMLLDRYNQVKGTDFEFVRLVKKLESGAAGLNIKIQFNAKSSAAAECTLKTFEGFVFKYWNFHHRVFPMSCRLLRPDPLGYMCDEESLEALKKKLIDSMNEANTLKEKAKTLSDDLRAERQLILEKDEQLLGAKEKLKIIAAKAVEAFQQTDEYNTVLFSWYLKGFELLRRYLVKHPTGVDLENLDLEEVDKEMAVDEAAQSSALEGDAPENAPTNDDDA